MFAAILVFKISYLTFKETNLKIKEPLYEHSRPNVICDIITVQLASYQYIIIPLLLRTHEFLFLLLITVCILEFSRVEWW